MTEKDEQILDLNKVLIVECFLKEHSDIPISLDKLKTKFSDIDILLLEKILDYLYINNKIIFGSKGIQWIYSDSKKIKNLLKDSYEIKYEPKD